MTRTEAVAALTANSNPHAHAVFAHRDATGQHWIEVRCWIAEDGELVRAHPTDARHYPIAAPADADFRLVEPGDDEAWREEQAADELARRDLEIYRSEFGDDAPDEAWFTAAFEHEREPGCEWPTYWARVLRHA